MICKTGSGDRLKTCPPVLSPALLIVFPAKAVFPSHSSLVPGIHCNYKTYAGGDYKSNSYVRVCSDEQAREGISPEDQRDKVVTYCELNDIELVDVIASLTVPLSQADYL